MRSSAKPDPSLDARNRQFLRLILCALAEGLGEGLERVVIKAVSEGEVLKTSCRFHDEIIRFLYGQAFAPVLEVAAEDRSGRVFRDGRSFLDERLKPALRLRLGGDFSEGKWSALREELDDSAVNEARARGAQSQLYAQLAALIARRGETTLFGYLTRSPAAAADLERLGQDTASLLVQIGSFTGHRTHPCTKTRLWLADGAGPERRPQNAAAFAAFAPEAAPDVALPVLAVAKSRVTISLSRSLGCDYGAFFAKSFPEAHRAWLAGVTRIAGGAAADRYVPLPAHPLQMEAIRARFAGPIAAGDILLETGVSILQRPTISLRTFTPIGRPAEPQIKTALAMLMTSEVRTISPARSFNAPPLSDLLLEVIARDPQLRGRFRVLPDPAAIAWGRDPDPASADYKDGFHLNAILRRNPSSLVGEGEFGLPLNALLSPSPAGGSILIAEIMREAGTRSPAEAIAWFESYAGLVLGVTLRLLTRYGISIEAHQQNTDLVFDARGRPTAIAYRDISGGIEICEPMLAARGYDIRAALHPFIRSLTSSIGLPIQQTMHTTFVSHLFPAAAIIADAFGLDTTPLFSAMRRSIAAALADARQHLQGDASEAAWLFREALDAIEHRILRAPIETKCLLQMRAAQTHDVRFTAIENPLARP